jgi:hypothetical protein
MPHEKQCLEKRKSVLWQRVEEAKQSNDRKAYNNAYQLYHVNEKKLGLCSKKRLKN